MQTNSVTADRYVYADILQKICIGYYTCGAKLPTINNMSTQYNLASTTIKKALKTLADNQFIKGETSRGTRVLFDCENPLHIQRLRDYAQSTRTDDFNDVQIPAVLLACLVHSGIAATKEPAKQRIVHEIAHILNLFTNNEAFIYPAQQLLVDIVNQTQNKFMVDMLHDIFRQFIVFIPPAKVMEEPYTVYMRQVALYFERLRYALETGEHDSVKADTLEFYTRINHIPYIVLIIPTNQKDAIFLKEKLYIQIARDMFAQVVSGKVKKGQYFLSTPKLCAKYGADRHTICSAYEVLQNFQIIEVSPYKGAKLISGWDEPASGKLIRHWLETQMSNVSDAVEVFDSFMPDILSLVAHRHNPQMIKDMQQNLSAQMNPQNGCDMLPVITDAIVTPLVESIQSAAFHRHYNALLDIICNFSVMSAQSISRNIELEKDVFYKATQALVALSKNDISTFFLHFYSAIEDNKRIYKGIISHLIMELAKDKKENSENFATAEA